MTWSVLVTNCYSPGLQRQTQFNSSCLGNPLLKLGCVFWGIIASRFSCVCLKHMQNRYIVPLVEVVTSSVFYKLYLSMKSFWTKPKSVFNFFVPKYSDVFFSVISHKGLGSEISLYFTLSGWVTTWANELRDCFIIQLIICKLKLFRSTWKLDSSWREKHSKKLWANPANTL